MGEVLLRRGRGEACQRPDGEIAPVVLVVDERRLVEHARERLARPITIVELTCDQELGRALRSVGRVLRPR